MRSFFRNRSLRFQLAASATWTTGAALLLVLVLGEVGMAISQRAALDPAQRPDWGEFALRLLQGLPGTALLLLPFALAAGTVLGLVAGRGLVGRFERLQSAAGAWSEGDLASRVGDRAGDELGELSRHLDQMAERLDELLGTRQELAAMEERNRLARELHDTVKQQVFSLRLFLSTAASHLPDDPDGARRPLEEAQELARAASRELGSLILELRPAALDGKGLAPALRELAENWSRQTEISAEVRVRGERPLDLELESALFRIAQEALANAARHSGAEEVEMVLAIEPPGESASRASRVELEVRDNGGGFAASEASMGHGLLGMRERMAALGGELEVRAKPGEGTRVVARCAAHSAAERA